MKPIDDNCIIQNMMRIYILYIIYVLLFIVNISIIRLLQFVSRMLYHVRYGPSVLFVVLLIYQPHKYYTKKSITNHSYWNYTPT